jgi:hypothetical protein
MKDQKQSLWPTSAHPETGLFSSHFVALSNCILEIFYICLRLHSPASHDLEHNISFRMNTNQSLPPSKLLIQIIIFHGVLRQGAVYMPR